MYIFYWRYYLTNSREREREGREREPLVKYITFRTTTFLRYELVVVYFVRLGVVVDMNNDHPNI